MYALNNGVRIYYEVEGEGPPLLLHHGFTQSTAAWRMNGFVDALKDDFRLIMLDSRGHGASDRPHDAAAYGMEARVGDVLAALDAAGVGRAHYFGYSLGGWIGFGMARYAPERIASLTLGGAHPYGQSMDLYRRLMQGNIDDLLSAMERIAGITAPPALREQFLSNDIEALRAAYAEDRPDVSGVLATIDVPVLLFAGEYDDLKAGAERCARELRDARFVELPGLNHVQAGLQLAKLFPHLREFLTLRPAA